MEPDERQHADALDLHWDAVLGGHPLTSRPAHNADLAELIPRLHAAIITPPLFTDPQQAWDEFKQRTALPDAPLTNTSVGAPPIQFTPNGRVAALLSPRPASRILGPLRSPAMGLLATAALLVLTLTAGLVAYWQGSRSDDELIAVPALVTTPDGAPSTPRADEVTDERLFTATFTTDELPMGEAGAVFYRITLAPGATLPNLGGLTCGCSYLTLGPGVGAELIQSGEYTVLLDAPIRVQHRGMSPKTEDHPAGTEITLVTGDAAIYPRYDAPGEIHNSGTSPAVVVGVVIVGAEGSGTPTALPEGAQGKILTQTVPSAWESLPAGPVTVTLRQVTLPAAATLGPYEAAGLEAFQLERGSIARSFLGAGATEPRARSLFHAVGTSASAFASVSPGTGRIITNVGDEPAVLLVLTIEPAGSGLTLLPP